MPKELSLEPAMLQDMTLKKSKDGKTAMIYNYVVVNSYLRVLVNDAGTKYAQITNKKLAKYNFFYVNII